MASVTPVRTIKHKIKTVFLCAGVSLEESSSVNTKAWDDCSSVAILLVVDIGGGKNECVSFRFFLLDGIVFFGVDFLAAPSA